MRGAGGYANIFDRVKKSCKQIVRELGPGDTLTVIAFDSSVKVQSTVTIHGDTEISRIDGLIDDLRAEGAWTFTAKALRNALEEAARLEKTFPMHNQAVVILTDGWNDPPPGDPEKGLSLESVAKPYAGKPWYVYLVQLGPKVDTNLSEALKSFPHGTTIHDPRGPRLSELHEKVKPKPKDVQPTLGFQRVLQRAVFHVQSSGKKEVSVANVLVAIFSEKHSHSAYLLTLQDVSRLDVVNYISHGLAKSGDERESRGEEGAQPEGERDGDGASALDKYATNLNKLAQEGRIDPLIGRQLEIERTVEILCRRRKNNPLYVGEAGVGKTALVEGLARLIVEGKVPEVLAGITVPAATPSRRKRPACA